MSRTGRLFLCPAPLDFGCEPPLPAITDVLPAGTLQTMAGLQYWACENAKTLRQLLKRVDEVVPLQHPLQEMQISVLPRDMHKKGDHAGGSTRSWKQEALQLLQPALQGHDMGLASEAGMPAVADPGSSLVRAAHEVGIQVVPLTGPSSILLALAASGLNGQNFAFIGYLPQDPAAREKRLKELETLARKTGQAQLWIETPYRNNAMLEQVLRVLSPDTVLCIAHGLTLSSAGVTSAMISRHRQSPPQLPPKVPALFGIGP